MEIDESLSRELRPSLVENAHARLFKNPYVEATSRLAAEIEDVRSESEDKVDDLTSEIESLQTTIEDLREQIVELQNSPPDDVGDESDTAT